MLLSVVIPAFNEEACLPQLFRSLSAVMARLDCDCEVIIVDDGSRDGTAQAAREMASADSRYKLVTFTRNFGHQAAITAGLDFASGDAAVVMDADLQDPPEVLLEMVRLYRDGFDVVSAQRAGREGDGLWKRLTARLFYRLMRAAVDERLVPEVGDFRLFSRAAVVALRTFRERHRFMRGLVAWLGLREAVVPFHRPARAAGETKYPLRKMLVFSWTAVTSFSGLPLRVGVLLGLCLTAVGGLYLLYAFYVAFVLHATVRGWTSLVALQTFFFGATMLAVGLMGDYLARLYEEAKARPLYVVQDAVNLTADGPPADRAIVLPKRSETAGTRRQTGHT